MDSLKPLLTNNRTWAQENKTQDPDFFSRLSAGQSPQYLWIGCCDSRVPAEMLTGAQPGDLLVHRNVANMVLHDDTNCLSVLQFAVEALKIKHIVVAGHYDCGGVKAALNGGVSGKLGCWLHHLEDIYQQHKAQFDLLTDEEERINLLCELNVAHQVVNVANTTTVRKAWQNHFPLTIHGCIYDIGDGLLKEIGVSVNGPDAIPAQFQSADHG
ncbi:carbonate dehydratase [Kistimonas scapharcae]|uniref:Carbonic anhydrase n=1 Tax=Kistimonas scapharcae TaxID=1036133 RepID=A0ABP8VA03_9GAMM